MSKNEQKQAQTSRNKQKLTKIRKNMQQRQKHA